MYRVFTSFLVFGILLLISCAKDSPVPLPDPETKAKLFFETSVTHPVLFAVLNVPENKSDATGWIISKDGDVSSFTLPIAQLDVQTDVVSLEYLARIMGASTPDHQIAFADILSYYQANKGSAYGSVKPFPDEIESSTTYYFGYTGYDKQLESQSTCGSGHPSLSSGPTPNYFYQVTLEVSGLHNALNENPGAIKTVSWLKSLQSPNLDNLGN